jgi:hypothetical protein
MIRWAFMCLGLAVGCVSNPVPSVSTEGGGGHEVLQELGSVLTHLGYTSVPMVRLPTGHFSVGGTADTVSLDMIVDTGASHTMIDVQRASRFDLATEDRGGRATGIGGPSQRVRSGNLGNVAIGPVRFDSLRVTVLDLSQVNGVLRGLGNRPVDGIIGADLLMSQQAVIDYGTLTLYFKE